MGYWNVLDTYILGYRESPSKQSPGLDVRFVSLRRRGRRTGASFSGLHVLVASFSEKPKPSPTNIAMIFQISDTCCILSDTY